MVCPQNINLKKRVTKNRSKWLKYVFFKLVTSLLPIRKKEIRGLTQQKTTKKLYNKLINTYNPNRFVNSENYETAVVIFQDVVRNKLNHAKLLEIEKQGILRLKGKED